MEILFFLVYVIFCITIAYNIGIEKKIGFSYSFLLSFFLTPILGFFISFYSNKIPNNDKINRIYKIVGSLLFYPSLILSIFTLFFFYREFKQIDENPNKIINDSISISSKYHRNEINKIIYSKGILMAELKSGNFELIDDTLIYKSYISIPQKTIYENSIRELFLTITKLELEINSKIKNGEKPTKKINKHNELLKKYNQNVKELNLINEKIKNDYITYKIENPSWWYFKSNQRMVYIFLVLIILTLIGKFLLFISKIK